VAGSLASLEDGPSVRVLVRLKADAPRKLLEVLVEHATLWSPVANTLHDPMRLDVILA